MKNVGSFVGSGVIGVGVSEGGDVGTRVAVFVGVGVSVGVLVGVSVGVGRIPRAVHVPDWLSGGQAKIG